MTGGQAAGTGDAVRYAVLFRTHVWDDFIERQYRRLVAAVGTGDVFIVANADVPGIPDDASLPAVVFREDDAAALGHALVGTYGLFWYNVDYPLYIFAARFPDYDYYIVCEYDAATNVELDTLVASMRARGADAIGLSTMQRRQDWWFAPSCEGIYPVADMQRMLFPFGVFSRRAVQHLAARRTHLSECLQAGEISVWPHCELFIPTELAMAGLVTDELSLYGSVAKFDYKPAHLEGDLASLEEKGFIHPLLDSQRYVANAFKNDQKPERFFLPGSALRLQLSRLRVKEYGPSLGHALRLRVSDLSQRFRHTLGRRLPGRRTRTGAPADMDRATRRLWERRGSVPRTDASAP